MPCNQGILYIALRKHLFCIVVVNMQALSMGSVMVVLTFAVKHNLNVFCVENAFQWDHFLSRLFFVWLCFQNSRNWFLLHQTKIHLQEIRTMHDVLTNSFSFLSICCLCKIIEVLCNFITRQLNRHRKKVVINCTYNY